MCRDMRLWTCDDCEAAYRAWACSVAFRRCNTTNPSGFMVPTCDDVCWATVRQCPATQQFSCPNNVRFCHMHGMLITSSQPAGIARSWLPALPCSHCRSCLQGALRCGLKPAPRQASQCSRYVHALHAETVQLATAEGWPSSCSG